MPWKIIWPVTIKQGDWDPGLATGHAVRPAAEVNHPVHRYRYIFSAVDLYPAETEGKAG